MPIIAVDAALGRPEEVGQIRYRLGGVQAGCALGRRHGGIGHLAVLGVVGVKGEDALATLLEVPFGEVERLAERIARHLAAALTAEATAC